MDVPLQRLVVKGQELADTEALDSTCPELSGRMYLAVSSPSNAVTQEGWENQDLECESALALPVSAEAESSGCPICMETIDPDDAAMRCEGRGGVHHYVHQQCMMSWIRGCRERGVQANCPTCRGALQFQAHRIDEFLTRADASDLDPRDRHFLTSLADKIRGNEEWTSVDRHNIGLLVACGAGCATGCLATAAAADWSVCDQCLCLAYMFPTSPLETALLREGEPHDMTMAFGLGACLGCVARLICEATCK